MKFLKRIGLALAALCVGALLGGAAIAQYSASNYSAQGGAYWGVAGVIDIVSGGAIKVAGTDKTTALAAAVTAPVAGVAASYKVARGETALDGSNPTDVATGLTTVVACTAAIKATAAPGVGTSIVTYSWSSATLSLYGWKVTATGDATLVASTGTETIGWVCVGT